MGRMVDGKDDGWEGWWMGRMMDGKDGGWEGGVIGAAPNNRHHPQNLSNLRCFFKQ